MDHGRVLDRLLGLKAVQAVHLVARTVIANANVTEGKAWVFIPDMHLLSRTTAREYKYSFTHDRNGAIGRNGLMAELGEALGELRHAEPDGVFVFQLGDLIDVWRENRVAEIEDLSAFAQRVLKDNSAARDFLVDASSLSTSLVLGNHDHVGAHSLMRDDAFRRMKASFLLPPEGSVLVTHGDLLDPIEALPDRWSRWGSRFTRLVGSGTRDLTGARRIEKRADVPGRIGVKGSHGLFEGALQLAKGLRLGRKKQLDQLKLRTKKPVKILVIGHTHHARLAIRDGLVILDAGAWIEMCKLDGRVVPSCQIAVIAQASNGTDLRIYQLTPA
jgi:UDP-2,3-diacylglucosamine pyrophosphatase LpxH